MELINNNWGFVFVGSAYWHVKQLQVSDNLHAKKHTSLTMKAQRPFKQITPHVIRNPYRAKKKKAGRGVRLANYLLSRLRKTALTVKRK